MTTILKTISAAIFVVLFALGSVLWSLPAQAMSFKDAAKSGAMIKIDQLDPMKGFLARAASKVISKLPMTNVQAEEGGLTGDVSMRGLQWRVVVHAGEDVSTSFIAFAPKSKFKFSHLIGSNPAADMFDLMSFDHQMLLIAAADVELESGDMPDNVKAALAPLYDGAEDFTLELDEGFSLLGSVNMAKSGIIKASLDFLGAKSTVLQMKGVLSVTILDSMVEALSAPKTPTIKLAAVVPKFRPRLGGLVELPADIQFSYVAELEKGGKPVLGMEGETEFSIGSQKMNIVLSNSINLGKGAPDFVVAATLFKGLPYKKAFGLSWLTIENYKMVFKLNASGTLVVQFEGDTSIGDKAVTLGGGLSIGTKTAGLPIPQSLLIAIDDGPDKVASLALKDILSIYNAMAKATGNPATVPLDKVPDVAIAGTGKGKEFGPRIELVMEGGGDDGFDIQGKLRILGSDVAVVDKAYVKTGDGVEIRARVNKFRAGPITFPNGEAEIVVKLEQVSNTKSKPRVLIRSQGLSVFGSKQELDLALYLTQANFSAKQHFGDLFKFDFKAFAGFQKLVSYKDLGNADFRLLASLSSDPGKWIQKSGKVEVQKYFKQLEPGFAVALKTLDDAKRKVDTLSTQIRRARDTVKRERQSAENAIKGAENEVNRLQGEINHFTRRMADFQRQIRSCHQTRRICTWYGLRRNGCHKSYFGHCVIPRYSHYCGGHATVPDYPTRAWCEAQNTKPRAEKAWAFGKKNGAIAAKSIAVKTLQGLRSGLSNIPTDLDPRVAGLIASKETAKLALDAAKLGVKGLAEFKKILDKAVNSLNAPQNLFVLKKSSIRGSLTQAFKGEPVVLDMDFTVGGKPFKNRLSFTMGNQVDNVRRFGVVALGIAVHEVIRLGKAAKVIPHKFLDSVEELYLKEMASLNEKLKQVTKANGNIATDPKDAAKSLRHGIDVDKRVRQIKIAAERQKQIDLRNKFGDILSNARVKQLDGLLKGNKWKHIPAAALDIGAGANGSVWHIDVNQHIYHWTGRGWRKVNGAAKRIDVGPQGHAWVVNKHGNIFRWNGRGWDKKPGKAIDIGVGADGTVWVVGTDKGLYRWNGANWDKMPGGDTIRIDVDPQGRAWGIQSNNAIWRWNPRKNNWDRIPTGAIDVSVGADGTVIAIGRDRAPYAWDGKKWNKMPGGDIGQITVDRNGNPWGINSAGSVYAWDKASKAPAARITSKPWKPEGGKWGVPTVSKEGDIVTITGSIKGGDYGLLWTIPKNMAPPQQLVFNLNNHAKPTRIDVLPDGRILWVAGGRDHGWLSLAGITYSVKKGKPLSLVYGWKPEGGKWGIPTVTKSGNLVSISGSIKPGRFDGKSSHVANLPAGYRPSKTMVFNVNNHAKSARVDVTPEGWVIWQAGGHDHGWLSLSGITFSTAPGTAIPLVNGWKPEGGAWARPTASRQGDMVTLSGTIKGGKWGHLATLPTGFQPPKQLVFSANNHEHSARVDVKENGQIVWVAGGKSHGWVSLAGISFQTDQPFYDQVAYLVRYPDLQHAFVRGTAIDWNALSTHWRDHGLRERRNAKPLGKCGNSGGIAELKGHVFDPCYYINSAKNRDLKKAFGAGNLQAATSHWFTNGIREGRESNKGRSTFRQAVTMTFQVKGSGRCFDQAGNDKQGTQAQSWDCNARHNNQRFHAVYKNGEWFSLVNHRNKMCVGVAGASKNNGAAVVQWPCVHAGDHLWRKVDRGGGWFSFVNRVSQKCLNLAYGKKPNGSKFDQYKCGATNPTQLFRITTASKPQTGGGLPARGPGKRLTGGGLPPANSIGESRLLVQNSNKCLDVASALKTDGAKVQQWGCHGGPNQKWRMESKGGGWFLLRARHSNKCLDVASALKTNGAKVQQWQCHGGTNQQWRKHDRGGGWFLIQNRNSSRCLNMANGRKNNGAVFDQYQCGHKNPTQMFRSK